MFEDCCGGPRQGDRASQMARMARARCRPRDSTDVQPPPSCQFIANRSSLVEEEKILTLGKALCSWGAECLTSRSLAHSLSPRRAIPALLLGPGLATRIAREPCQFPAPSASCEPATTIAVDSSCCQHSLHYIAKLDSIPAVMSKYLRPLMPAIRHGKIRIPAVDRAGSSPAVLSSVCSGLPCRRNAAAAAAAVSRKADSPESFARSSAGPHKLASIAVLQPMS